MYASFFQSQSTDPHPVIHVYTGLCGSWFTDYSARMVGVDISPKMVEQVRASSKEGMKDGKYQPNPDWPLVCPDV